MDNISRECLHAYSMKRMRVCGERGGNLPSCCENTKRGRTREHVLMGSMRLVEQRAKSRKASQCIQYSASRFMIGIVTDAQLNNSSL